jgi:membrane AbrB-like protein
MPEGAFADWGRGSGWVLALLAAFVIGEATETVLPASHLLVSLVVGLTIAGFGMRIGQVPRVANRTSQALLGVVMGAYLNIAALRATAGAALPLLAVTAATMLLSIACAGIIVRIAGMDRATATLGMTPGGSAAIVACAKDLDADAPTVAFLQYLRVAIVAFTAPAAVTWLLTAHPTFTTSADLARAETAKEQIWQLIDAPDQVKGAVLLVAVTILGIQAGRWLHLPTPTLFGPMLVTAALTNSGLTGFGPADTLQELLFTIIGLDIGLRFTRQTFTHIRRLLPLTLTTIIGVNLACAALAWALSCLTGIPTADAYLATTPGGINAVLASAVATGANIPLISTVQSLRLFAMVALAPLLIRSLPVPATTPRLQEDQLQPTPRAPPELVYRARRQ